MSKEIAEEYASSLSDLTVNSKPLINMLTILAEENIDHAGVIVETVEKHLEKVNPDIKLPVLYLVDSIIKNVGGAYTTKFSQSIVNMFTRTFKQVDEKVRSQMFKLRETWHDVFPATKMYQLDVKVNLIDPAWPIQAQPQQSNIHVNPNFLKKTTTTSHHTVVPKHEEDEKMRSILAKKEQELLMLQKKKVEMELEQMRKQLELDKTSGKKTAPVIPVSGSVLPPPTMPIALVNPVVATTVPPAVPPTSEVAPVNAKQRLGPPVNKPAGIGRIAPVSAALATARRDPRLARLPPAHARPSPPALTPAPPPPPPPTIAANVFDIKPLERVTKRKNVITIDVRPEPTEREPRRRDPRLVTHTPRDPRRDRPRDPQRDKRREDRLRRPTPALQNEKDQPIETEKEKKNNETDEINVNSYMDKLHVVDTKRITKLPPIPKKIREERPGMPPAPKRKKEPVRDKKKKRDDSNSSKDSSSGSSPEKRLRAKEAKKKPKEPPVEGEAEKSTEEPVAFKELKNYHKERYMRRNKEKSESPEKVPEKEAEAPPPAEIESSNIPEIVVENKDIDLRVLPAVSLIPAVVAQKRSSTETLEGKPKKNKMDKFDILFGNEDVDLRQLPQVEEISAPPPPCISDSPSESPKKPKSPPRSPIHDEELPPSPKGSPKKDWNEVKEKKEKEEVKKTPSKLDLVRAKLAEATKGKDRLGRPLLFSKSPSIEKERRRTLSSDDTDMRGENGEDFDTEDHKKTISIIMSQAKEQFSDGQLDKNQYNALMFQVLQLNEKLKLKEAKQRESLEISKRKLKANTKEEHIVTSPKSSPSERNRFGDIDERTLPAVFLDTPRDSQAFMQDSDMRNMDGVDRHNDKGGLLPLPPPAPIFGTNMPNIPNMPPMPFPPVWRGQLRPRTEEFVPRRFRGPVPPFFRAKFETRGLRGPFDMPLMPIPPLPMPQIGMCQGESPLRPYERCESPPPLGAPGFAIPPTDFRIIEYIDQDPVKTIQIDGIPREIRFYENTAVIMLDWDDPRDIKFLPGCRRVTFDNKDSVVISFNEGYKQIEIEDQVFDIKFGAPTRELYINGRWHECFFGGSPLGVLIDGKPRLVHLEGPMPQVDIGKEKRTDLIAGKINLIVNATQMCPVYLDAKVQKFVVNNQVFTIRFADALRTVLINEQPFKVEFGDLPKPIFIGNEKHFIRFSALPRNIKPGFVQIAQMEGSGIPTVPMLPITKAETVKDEAMETDEVPPLRPVKTPSPDALPENQGLDMLASVMPTSVELASGSDYSLAEPLFTGEPNKIPCLETPTEEKPVPMLPVLGNINVTDLFAKLVATGIVQVQGKTETKMDNKVEEAKFRQKEVDKSVVHRVDLLRPETLRGKQPALVALLYGGMQCSSCGARFPPEHTVRYSQHLDWHFRQNRRERDSARRAHSRHWHYDLSDWLQYEEIDELDDRGKHVHFRHNRRERTSARRAHSRHWHYDLSDWLQYEEIDELDDREKNWFETGGGTEEGETPFEPPVETPSVAAGAPAESHCAMCGDKFDQFYNEDKEEWHLRNSVRHEEQNYHPMCFEDYKASLTKEEPPQESQDDVVALDKTEETILIKDVEDESTVDDQSDNESVVEVVDEVEEKPAEPEPVEIDEGEEDDVIYKAEPVVEVLVEDEVETDDETQEKRAERDRQAEIDFSMVKVKQEPVDPDDEPIITAEEENITPAVSESTTPHTTTTSVLSSIDGNVQLDAAPAPVSSIPIGGIRINISKSAIPTFLSTSNDPMLDDISADDEPLPPGEEPELEYKLKPTLEGVQFSRQPPLAKGNELSGLCSIM